MQKNQNKMLGFSLLEIMIGLAITASVLYIVQDRLGDSMKAGKRVGLIQAKQAAEQFLTTHVSCGKSFLSASCSPGQVVGLKDANDTTIVSPTAGRRMGEWTIRAQCNSDGDGYIAKVAWIKPDKTLTNATSDDDFYPDPLTKKPLNWTNIMSSLLDGADICPSKAGSNISWCAMGDGCNGEAVLCISLSTHNIYYNYIQFYSGSWRTPSGSCDGGVLVKQ